MSFLNVAANILTGGMITVVPNLITNHQNNNHQETLQLQALNAQIAADAEYQRNLSAQKESEEKYKAMAVGLQSGAIKGEITGDLTTQLPQGVTQLKADKGAGGDILKSLAGAVNGFFGGNLFGSSTSSAGDKPEANNSIKPLLILAAIGVVIAMIWKRSKKTKKNKN